MPEITLQDGRTMDMMTWFRNLFIDATSFNFNDKSSVIVVTASLREITLSTINIIIETLKLNGYQLDGSKMQFRARSITSFDFWLLIKKDL